MAQAPATTDHTFAKDVLSSDLPVVVDFWADWCGPCRVLAPTLDAVAQELAGKLRIFKLDVDANPATTQRFSIQSIPTLIFFSGGEPRGQVIGLQSREALLREIERAVGVRP